MAGAVRRGPRRRHPGHRAARSGWATTAARPRRSSSGCTPTPANSTTSGQWLYYGKVGGCLITGNEDGIKHCASNVLYSLQHIGYSIPPQADAGWIGEAGPGPSYGDLLDDGTRAGLDNDFTNRNTTFMTWNLLHLARMLKDAGGFPAYGNQRREWDAGTRFDFPNPEYRS